MVWLGDSDCCHYCNGVTKALQQTVLVRSGGKDLCFEYRHTRMTILLIIEAASVGLWHAPHPGALLSRRLGVLQD